MADLAVTRCAQPTVRGTSTYTILGFAGYGLASIVAATLFVAWDLPLADRLIVAFAPPLAFLAVVAITRAIVGSERIVFFQTAAAGVVVAGVLALAAGGEPARVDRCRDPRHRQLPGGRPARLLRRRLLP